jgi:hypothetical protein
MTTPEPVSLAALAAKVERLERELARRQDLDEIHDVLDRYARAVDWLDAEILESVFFDDAEIDYGFFKGSGKDFKPLLMDIERPLEKRQHYALGIKVDLRGDVADVRSYQWSVSTMPGVAEPGRQLLTAFGYYVDRMERRQGRWGIARRKHLAMAGVTLEHMGSDGFLAALNHLGAATPAHPDYLPNTRAAKLPTGR